MLVPVNCRMSNWGQCSASCGEDAIKTREIVSQPENGGTECGAVTESCNYPACRGKF